MFGAVGTSGATGAAPRLGETNEHNSEAPSPTNLHGAPSEAFNCAGVTDFACAVAVSPTQSSMPLSRCCVNAKRLPSDEKPSHDSAGLAGTLTFFSVPSAMLFNVMLRESCARCGPLVRGLM